MPQDPQVAAQYSPSSLAAKRLYTKFMLEIEPDLIPSNLPLLKWKYANETEAEHAERMERYQQAFDAFDKKMEEFLGDVSQTVRDVRRRSLEKKEAKSRVTDVQELQDMESRFTSL